MTYQSQHPRFTPKSLNMNKQENVIHHQKKKEIMTTDPKMIQHTGNSTQGF